MEVVHSAFQGNGVIEAGKDIRDIRCSCNSFSFYKGKKNKIFTTLCNLVSLDARYNIADLVRDLGMEKPGSIEDTEGSMAFFRQCPS